jgi:hypothetical protein
MTTPAPARRRRKVGVYDRPASADINWIRWIVMIIALLVAAFFLYRMMS